MIIFLQYKNLLCSSQKKSMLSFLKDNLELTSADPWAVLGCKTELLVFRHELGARSEAIGLEVRGGKDGEKEL